MSHLFRREFHSPGARVTGDCVLPDMTRGNQTTALLTLNNWTITLVPIKLYFYKMKKKQRNRQASKQKLVLCFPTT